MSKASKFIKESRVVDVNEATKGVIIVNMYGGTIESVYSTSALKGVEVIITEDADEGEGTTIEGGSLEGKVVYASSGVDHVADEATIKAVLKANA